MARRKRKHTPETKFQMNLVKLVERFGSEQKCRQYLEELRWPDGVSCPRCESARITGIPQRHQFHCNECRYQFSVTAGSILHDSHLPLWKWFLAVYMMTESKKGVSANQIKRTIGCAYKTAWFLCHRIRAAMGRASTAKLNGIVEADETLVGDKRKGIGRGYVGNKAVVAGAVERGGEARLKHVPDKTRETLHAFLREHTDDDTEAIYTHESPSYEGIEDEDTRHKTVNHSIEEYVRGDVHTNTAESVWSLLKRSIVGAYHHVSPKHLDAYLDELEFRFGNRRNPWLFRETIRALLSSDALTYEKLTA